MKRNASLPSRHVLITGGAGFIGTNLAAWLLANTDERLVILDNLSRPGVVLNLAWLKTLDRSGRLKFVRGDVRNADVIAQSARFASAIYHLAATSNPPGQPADPKIEFDVNVTGTVNVLEAARASATPVLYASSAKVYGTMNSVPVVREGWRYRPADHTFTGVTESMPVDYHCTDDCTKSVADQYVRDYARLYNLPTVALRIGGIAGPGQFGNEGQGWVAHFVYSTLAGRAVTIFGDGFNVRDVLHASDLVEAMQAARAYLPVAAGRAFNIGGGITRSVSVVEMLRLIEQICHQPVQQVHQLARPSDQLYYVSDNSLFTDLTGWMPRRTLEQTVRDIVSFWKANRQQLVVPRVASPRRHHTRAA